MVSAEEKEEQVKHMSCWREGNNILMEKAILLLVGFGSSLFNTSFFVYQHQRKKQINYLESVQTAVFRP